MYSEITYLTAAVGKAIDTVGVVDIIDRYGTPMTAHFGASHGSLTGIDNDKGGGR